MPLPDPHHRWSVPAATLSTALLLLAPRPARAETTTAYKYQDYHESGGRISVRAHYGLVEQTIGPEARLKITGVIDTISGATPTGEPADPTTGQVPLTTIDDRREAWTADYSRQFGRLHVTVGAAHSHESDYVSTGFSLNTQTDFNGKNTTLLAGLSGTDDDVKVFYQTARASKRTLDAILGVTHLLDENTSVTANLSFGSADGYLSDPYKLIRKNTEILPGLFLPLTFSENRPDERDKWIVFTSINRTVPKTGGALEASYRHYHDTYSVTSHTTSLAWFQHLGEQVILSPSVRYYWQGKAYFYRVSLDGSNITPGTMPNPAGPFFSADYRLAALDTWTWGLKLVWTPKPAFQADVAWESYRMSGRDRQTSASAFPEANIVTVGARYAW
ncbi:MAG TPA: DUF3570 domain-containing protein [Lacunisphaera sp.]|nr:DUF3570 domain-containing protein [Lacunisphaera sp.]